jgi:predicted NUDIX family NTP pyrophosphohydrolase
VLLTLPRPYGKKTEVGNWSIAKGEPEPDEDLLECARREFHEETGADPGMGPYIALGTIRQKGGKLVHAWAFEGRWDPASFRSNTFQIEWPRGSGRMATFPEVDRAEMMPVEKAMSLIKDTQRPLLERLAAALAG